MTKLCECGCGKEVKNRFVNGHNTFRGEDNPSIRPEVRKKIKESLNKPEVRTKRSRSQKIAQNRPELKEFHRQYMLNGHANYMNSFQTEESRKNQKQWMLNGGAAYTHKFIKKISNEELKIREMVLKSHPDFIPQYKVLRYKNYNVDLVHPLYKIAIEFDGYYHFKDQKNIDYHNRRQQEIEGEGWKFIRYNIFQKFPSKEQVKEDISKLIENRG